MWSSFNSQITLQSFFTLVAFVTVPSFFGALWGGIMWLLQWQNWHIEAEVAVLVSVLAGLLFGLSIAAYYRWKAASLDLPRSWKRYGKKLRRK